MNKISELVEQKFDMDKINELVDHKFDMNKISELIDNNFDMNKISENNTMPTRDELRRRLRAKTNTMKGNRSSKHIREQNQINELKENPMFQNADPNSVEVKNMIDSYASKMTSDPKQKKNIKKQMDNLIQKINNI